MPAPGLSLPARRWPVLRRPPKSGVIEGLAAFQTMLAGSQELRHALQSPRGRLAKRAVISRMPRRFAFRRSAAVPAGAIDHRRTDWRREIREAFKR